MLYFISDGELAGGYDARIELDGADVLLYSRGGATGGRPPRNTDYEKALLTIVRRLRASESSVQPAIARVLLDSQPARKMPLEKRLLVEASELSGLSDDQAVTLIRSRAKNWGQAAGVLGGNSTKALRIETQGHSYTSIQSTLKLLDWENKLSVNTLSAEEQGKVTSLHIDRAVERLRSNEDAPNFSESRDYDVLLDDGVRLAPKKVFGLALEEALGIKALPEHFNAGWGQPSFRIIETAGYLIVPKNEPLPTPAEVAEAQSVLPPMGGDSGMREGMLKLVIHMRRERDPRLSDEKKATFIAEHGFLYCERCNMKPAEHYESDVAAACIEVHHAKVQVKDMQEDHVTMLEDLQCLCANCHRVTHRELAVAARGLRKSNSR
ncbi:HNH endonuclease [Rhizobium sp. LEGMi198b]